MKERSRTPATKRIARERIDELFRQARHVHSSSPELSNRYVEIARCIAMRQRIQIAPPLRRRFCHHCSAYLVPGKNTRVRIHRGNVVVTCLACNRKTRFRVVGHNAGQE